MVVNATLLQGQVAEVTLAGWSDVQTMGSVFVGGCAPQGS